MSEQARFLALELGLALPVGALGGLCVLAFLAATRAVAPSTRAQLVALLAAPACGYAGWAAFHGASAQRIPGHQLLSLAVAAVGIGGVYLAARALDRGLPKLEARRSAALAIAFGAALLLAVDARVLPRLYAFFHRGLELGALALATLAALAWLRRRPRAIVAVLLVAGLAGAGLAATILRRAHALATILAERAPLGATLARAYPRRAAPALSAADDDVLVEVGSLPPGPHLGSRDIVLVTIDAMRADRLAPRVRPTLSRARRRAAYASTDAYTQVPHTSFSHRDAADRQVRPALSALGLDAASHETLAEVLRRERYKTAAFYPPAVFFIDHDRLTPLEETRLRLRVREVRVHRRRPAHRPGHRLLRARAPGARLRLGALLRAARALRAHTPATPPARRAADPRCRRRSIATTARSATSTHEVARLVDYLRRARPDALVVLAADHGEEFGEHGGRYHGTTLYDEQVRVPLVFATACRRPPACQPRAGGGAGRARRRGAHDPRAPRHPCLGQDARARSRALAGRDAAPPPARTARCSARSIARRWSSTAPQAGLRSRDRRLRALSICAVDPAERRDLSDREPAVAARLHRLLDRFLSEESRYERKVDAPPGLEHVFERARLGDAQVVPELTAALATMPPEPRAEALRLLVALPPDAATRAALEAITVEGAEPRLLLELARARVGDDDARARLRQALLGEQAATLAPELYVRGALASRDLELLSHAVERTEDRVLLGAVARALASTHDPRAYAPLLLALAPVRSRAEVVAALGELGDPRAVPELERWLPADPYVPVRVAVVHALVKLDAAGVRGALQAQLHVETDPAVLAALNDALRAKPGATRRAP